MFIVYIVAEISFFVKFAGAHFVDRGNASWQRCVALGPIFVDGCTEVKPVLVAMRVAIAICTSFLGEWEGR